MKRPTYGRDRELVIRMFFTMFMLGVVYVAFISLMFWAGMPMIFILGIAVAMALFQYFGSDKLVLMSTGARVVTPEQEPRLHAMIERLAAMADMPSPKKVAIMETHVPNAFATGRNPKNSVIAVTRGLLNRLDEREIEAVLGHELSHIRHRDVMVMTWASIIVIAAGYLLNMLFWISLFGGFGGGDRRDGDSGSAGLIMMAVFLGTILIYFASQLLIMALSRYREYAADRGGAMLTGSPLHLASALQKISSDLYRIPEKDLRQVEHANAFMFVNALKRDSMASRMASFLSSHPPVEKRVEQLRNMQRQMERGF